MKHRQILAILLVLAMLLMLGACGATASSSAPAESAGSAASTEEAPAQDEAAAAEPAAEPAVEPDAPAESSVEAEAEPEEPLVTIEYPLEGNPHFTMLACRNNVTAEAFAKGGYELTPTYTAISEATGVTFDFEMLAEQTYTEKLNLKIASDDLPDVVNSNIGQYASNPLGAIEDDFLMDIAPYLDECAPDYVRFLAKYPEVKVNVFNSDGSTSAFKSSGYPYQSKGLNIRKDWLDQVGMEAPTTIDEVTDTLRVFKSDMGASMPLLVTSDLGSGLEKYFNASYSGFRSIGFMRTEENGSEVVCTFAAEGFLNYLDYLHQLYDEGLVSNDFLTTGRDYGNFESAYLSGASGIWEDGSMQYNPALLSRGGEGYEPMPFVLSGEGTVHVSDVSAYDFIAGAAYITSVCHDPENICKFYNYCYTEPGQLLFCFGAEGVSWEYNEDGEIVWTDLITNNPDGWAVNLSRAFYTGMWLCGEGMYRTVELNNDEVALAAIDLWTENAGDKTLLLPADVQLDYDETLEFNTLAGDVLTAFTENTVKVVVGDITLDEYKDLIETLNGTGLARMTELYQGAFDRYLEDQ